jgi:hypothetical protein
VLSLRKRFGGESAPLAWVRRSLVNHVNYNLNSCVLLSVLNCHSVSYSRGAGRVHSCTLR